MRGSEQNFKLDEITTKYLIQLIQSAIRLRKKLLKDLSFFVNVSEFTLYKTTSILTFCDILDTSIPINRVKILYLFKFLYDSVAFNKYFKLAFDDERVIVYSIAERIIPEKTTPYCLNPDFLTRAVVSYLIQQLPYSKDHLDNINKALHIAERENLYYETTMKNLWLPKVDGKKLKQILLNTLDNYLKGEFAETNFNPFYSGPQGKRRALRLRFLITDLDPNDSSDTTKMIAYTKAILCVKAPRLYACLFAAFSLHAGFSTTFNLVFDKAYDYLKQFFLVEGVIDKSSLLCHVIHRCYHDLCAHTPDMTEAIDYIEGRRDDKIHILLRNKTTYFQLLPLDLKEMSQRMIVREVEKENTADVSRASL